MADTNKLLGHVLNDRYRIIDLIGKGGSGHVYRAIDLENDEPVALKILRDITADDTESVIRFEKEVAVSARLASPHTVRVIEFGKTREGYLLIAMEYLEGRPLSTVIEEEAPLAPQRALGIVHQTLEALAEAHRAGIVHRDLKPDNIFLVDQADGADFIKVLDFGIAKFLLDDSVGDTLSRDGFIFGTPLYISPEQALGWQVTHASDLYSLGVVFFEMLTGSPPFNAETPIGLGMKHIYEPPPIDRIRSDDPGLGNLKNLLSVMLDKRPERRPSNAGTCLALLDALGPIPEAPVEFLGIPQQRPAGADDSPTRKLQPDNGNGLLDTLGTDDPMERLAAQAAEVAREAADHLEASAPPPQPSPQQGEDTVEMPGKKRKRRKRKRRQKDRSTDAASAAPSSNPAPAAKAAPAPRPTRPAPMAAEDTGPILWDEDWRRKKRRKGEPQVGFFAWAVLLLGLALAAFLLYAVVVGGRSNNLPESTPQTLTEQMTPGPSANGIP